MGDATDLVGAERHELGLSEQAAESPPDPQALPAAVDGGEHGGADDGVEAGGVATPGGDSDSHCLPETASRIRRITSPGSAWRLADFLENTRRPSRSTSNTPPED